MVSRFLSRILCELHFISISILGMSFLLKKLLNFHIFLLLWQMKQYFYWCIINSLPPWTPPPVDTRAAIGKKNNNNNNSNIYLILCIYLVETEQNRFYFRCFVLTIRECFRVNICCIYYSIHNRTKPHNTPTIQQKLIIFWFQSVF